MLIYIVMPCHRIGIAVVAKLLESHRTLVFNSQFSPKQTSISNFFPLVRDI